MRSTLQARRKSCASESSAQRKEGENDWFLEEDEGAGHVTGQVGT
jgi:hypothetical protein